MNENTPLKEWAEAKQAIQELDQKAQEPAKRFLDASRALWRAELTARYPEATLTKAKIVIHIPVNEDPQKVVALGEAIVQKGGTVTQLLESEGNFYVVVS